MCGKNKATLNQHRLCIGKCVHREMHAAEHLHGDQVWLGGFGGRGFRPVWLHAPPTGSRAIGVAVLHGWAHLQNRIHWGEHQAPVADGSHGKADGALDQLRLVHAL